jgi:hypothetical protein
MSGLFAITYILSFAALCAASRRLSSGVGLCARKRVAVALDCPEVFASVNFGENRQFRARQPGAYRRPNNVLQLCEGCPEMDLVERNLAKVDVADAAPSRGTEKTLTAVRRLSGRRTNNLRTRATEYGIQSSSVPLGRSVLGDLEETPMPSQLAVEPALAALVARTNAHFAECDMLPVAEEQLECLVDGERTTEALEMVDDWSARLGLPDDLHGDLSEWIEGNEAVDDGQRSNGPRRR